MRRDDRGSIAPRVPIVMFVLLALGGLLVDGSRTLNARGNAEAYAEEAARAGASATDNQSSALTLVDATARSRVSAYCQAIEDSAHSNVVVTACALENPAFTAATTCDGSMQDIVVHVTVTVRIDTTLMGMVGFQHFSSTADASARPFEGPALGGDGRC